MSALERFAREVLEILERDKDWGPGTLDDISAVAFNLNLAVDGPDGMFKVRDRS